MGILVVWIAPPIWSRSPAKPSKCSATASLSVNPWAACQHNPQKQGNWVRMKLECGPLARRLHVGLRTLGRKLRSCNQN